MLLQVSIVESSLARLTLTFYFISFPIISDCYVAVCGLPQPRKDHAIAMVRFSREVLAKMTKLTQKLEATLGPDTSGLDLRVGIHSGPITAGVLRGAKSRFQIFGGKKNPFSLLWVCW